MVSPIPLSPDLQLFEAKPPFFNVADVDVLYSMLKFNKKKIEVA